MVLDFRRCWQLFFYRLSSAANGIIQSNRIFEDQYALNHSKYIRQYEHAYLLTFGSA
jgi:hypothetical protein